MGGVFQIALELLDQCLQALFHLRRDVCRQTRDRQSERAKVTGECGEVPLQNGQVARAIDQVVQVAGQVGDVLQQVIRQTHPHGSFHLGVVDDLLQGVQVGQQGVDRFHGFGNKARRLIQQSAQQPRLDGFHHIHQVDHPEDQGRSVLEEIDRVEFALHHLVDIRRRPARYCATGP